MATQLEASHNSAQRSSGKSTAFSSRRHLPLAAKVAAQLGIVRTWPNVQTILLAIESEAEITGAAFREVAEMLIRAAKESSLLPTYSCPSEWQKREVFRLNTVDRFWFEDARWRDKLAYQEFREGLMRVEVAC